MSYLAKHFQLVSKFFIGTIFVLLASCSHDEVKMIAEGNFVGEWHSTRSTMPIYLYGNGDWEIKNDDGKVLQYGVWQYKNNAIIWSHKAGWQVEHDVNKVLSFTPVEFQLRESDNSITTFTKSNPD
jgi:hypothetical protein